MLFFETNTELSLGCACGFHWSFSCSCYWSLPVFAATCCSRIRARQVKCSRMRRSGTIKIMCGAVNVHCGRKYDCQPSSLDFTASNQKLYCSYSLLLSRSPQSDSSPPSLLRHISGPLCRSEPLSQFSWTLDSFVTFLHLENKTCVSAALQYFTINSFSYILRIFFPLLHNIF